MNEADATPHQKWLLMLCRKGYGISAARGEMTAQHRREAEQMVASGILRRSKNYTADKVGMFVIGEDPGWSTEDASLT